MITIPRSSSSNQQLVEALTTLKTTRTQENKAITNMGQHVLNTNSQATPEDKRKFNEYISKPNCATEANNIATRVIVDE